MGILFKKPVEYSAEPTPPTVDPVAESEAAAAAARAELRQIAPELAAAHRELSRANASVVAAEDGLASGEPGADASLAISLHDKAAADARMNGLIRRQSAAQAALSSAESILGPARSKQYLAQLAAERRARLSRLSELQNNLKAAQAAASAARAELARAEHEFSIWDRQNDRTVAQISSALGIPGRPLPPGPYAA